MTTKTKGRNGGDRATPKTSDNRRPTSTENRFKALIVGAACWFGRGATRFKQSEIDALIAAAGTITLSPHTVANAAKGRVALAAKRAAIKAAETTTLKS